MAKIVAMTDLPADEDTLGVKPYIEGLAAFINKCSTPLTIAIQGDWGSGKTSMMGMTRDILNKKIYPVWFNTWQYSQFHLESELTISFMRKYDEISNDLNLKGEKITTSDNRPEIMYKNIHSFGREATSRDEKLLEEIAKILDYASYIFNNKEKD
ncbi:P-loop NTPase fold protein [Campylobacter corcagiensis]|uniref:KAP NTPase domain-containing protein n=1 Tax=Campylobacter corcagiensis TaxID=1448857 RepID=A0A7M1LIP7_9BACT|nr:P-loop NTPase fold protein [Campylobacter corcagiensis]QOQ87824.1 hypothetical protein IMC76_03190 [Campylobacter corcagiensis]